MVDADDFVHFFRSSAPYVHAHRGRTFVLAFGGEAIRDDDFPKLIQDVALLHSLGVNLVLVHGAGPQVERKLEKASIEQRIVNGRRIVDRRALQHVKEAVGAARVSIEALLSMGLPSSPMAGARIRVATGNFVVAQPIGVVDGTDYEFTGEVRRVDSDGIKERLTQDAIVLVTPLGYSLTGEVFELPYAEVASHVASAISADKLVGLVDSWQPIRVGKRRVAVASPADAEKLARRKGLTPEVRAHLTAAITACRGGVRRAHVIPRRIDGSLLRELFTADGIGTMVTAEGFGEARRARLGDVVGLLSLLEPMAEDGLLLRRPRELLEREIHRFAVIERDGSVIGCCALLVHTIDRLGGDRAGGDRPEGASRIGEVAALAVHPDHRQRGHGDHLLAYVERWARQEGLDRLFALTTRAQHWFVERGYSRGAIRDLPPSRREAWSKRRNSKALYKSL
jgi:amino-acid N-acetyltransferase